MRVAVPLPHAYRLLNHGPTTLVTSASGGRRNVMAAAWVTPLDTDPPRLTAVISADSYTRELIEQSGELVVNIPTVALAEQTFRAGRVTGRGIDKLQTLGFETAPASKVGAPLVEGCVAWLECCLLPEPTLRERFDLLLAEIVAAWADDAVFRGEWSFAGHPELRTLHHIGRGAFLADGERVEVGA